jgi:hypothetical protein
MKQWISDRHAWLTGTVATLALVVAIVALVVGIGAGDDRGGPPFAAGYGAPQGQFSPGTPGAMPPGVQVTPGSPGYPGEQGNDQSGGSGSSP